MMPVDWFDTLSVLTSVRRLCGSCVVAVRPLPDTRSSPLRDTRRVSAAKCPSCCPLRFSATPPALIAMHAPGRWFAGLLHPPHVLPHPRRLQPPHLLGAGCLGGRDGAHTRGRAEVSTHPTCCWLRSWAAGAVGQQAQRWGWSREWLNPGHAVAAAVGCCTHLLHLRRRVCPTLQAVAGDWRHQALPQPGVI